jgi:hypothetical protein
MKLYWLLLGENDDDDDVDVGDAVVGDAVGGIVCFLGATIGHSINGSKLCV